MRRRLMSRLVLAIVTTMVAASLVVQAHVASAQEDQPRPTPSPQRTDDFLIAFLNPSSYSMELSTKPDGVDESYHLIAWSNISRGSEMSATFAYQVGDGPKTEIATVPQGAYSSTFEVFWDPPADIADDVPFKLSVLSHLDIWGDAEDEIEVRLNDSDDGSGPRGETAELLHTNSENFFGLNKGPDGITRGAVKVSVSEGTSSVKLFYSRSNPSNDPLWEQCGSAAVEEQEFWVVCTIHPDDEYSDVHALAVLADEDSGDAHRVHSFAPQFGEITLDLPAQEANAGECSALVTVTASDGQGAPVIGAMLDVHAFGPDGSVTFGVGDGADGFRAPTERHPIEPATDCLTKEPAGEQGRHDEATTPRKHIESAGTDDDGRWSFRLFSESPGQTQVLVWWEDRLGDDLFCSEEDAYHDIETAVVGWDQEPGPPTEHATDEPSCPSHTVVTTCTCDYTTGYTPAGDLRPGSRVSIRYGKTAFFGRVGSPVWRCRVGRLVTVKRTSGIEIGREWTRRDGHWRLRLPRADGRYRAVVANKIFTSRNGQRVVCGSDHSKVIAVAG